MRVDEYVKFIARRPTVEEARTAALEIAAAFPGSAKVTQVHTLEGPDQYGTFTYEVTIAPDWRGYDGS